MSYSLPPFSVSTSQSLDSLLDQRERCFLKNSCRKTSALNMNDTSQDKKSLKEAIPIWAMEDTPKNLHTSNGLNLILPRESITTSSKELPALSFGSSSEDLRTLGLQSALELLILWAELFSTLATQ